MSCSGPASACCTRSFGDDLAGSPHQAFEHQPFARRELDLGVVDAQPLAGEVDAHAVQLDDSFQGAAGAAHQRAATRRELGRLEGLAQEIVGADIERLDLVGEVQRAVRISVGRVFPALRKPPHQGEAVGPGEADVDHREREVLGGDGGAGGLGAARRGAPEYFAADSPRSDRVGDDVVVLNHQKAHGQPPIMSKRLKVARRVPVVRSRSCRSPPNTLRRGGRARAA